MVGTYEYCASKLFKFPKANTIVVVSIYDDERFVEEVITENDTITFWTSIDNINTTTEEDIFYAIEKFYSLLEATGVKVTRGTIIDLYENIGHIFKGLQGEQ